MQNSGSSGRPGLGLTARTADGVTVAELAGELGVASAPVLREQLLGLLRPGSCRLVIDLSGVSACDAIGLAVLVGAGRHASLLGGFVRLAAVSPQAARVLHATGLHRHFPTFATVGEAVTAPAAPDHGPPAGAAPGAAPAPGAPGAASWGTSAVA